LSTSGIEKKQNVRRLSVKTALVYAAVSVFCVAITNIYALFGHGVRSNSMDLMFLYPFLGGSLAFFTIALLSPFLHSKMQRHPRIAYNLYHSGIASITSAAMLTRIMEIA